MARIFGSIISIGAALVTTRGCQREPHKVFFGSEVFFTDPDGDQWAVVAPVG